MRIEWLHKALDSLDEEAAWIAADNPEAARIVVQRIVSAVNLLPGNPALGRPGRIDGTRELVVPDTPYLAPYRVRPRLKRIEILRIFHTARRPPTHW